MMKKWKRLGWRSWGHGNGIWRGSWRVGLGEIEGFGEGGEGWGDGDWGLGLGGRGLVRLRGMERWW